MAVYLIQSWYIELYISDYHTEALFHYDDVIMDAIASQITSLASVYSDV